MMRGFDAFLEKSPRVVVGCLFRVLCNGKCEGEYVERVEDLLDLARHRRALLSRLAVFDGVSRVRLDIVPFQDFQDLRCRPLIDQ